MKTSVTMVRRMGMFEVSQRTKDGMFNGSLLLQQWNKQEKKKTISNFLKLEKTKEFIQEIENDHVNKSELGLKAFITTKGRNTKKGKTSDETWLNPYLFIDFAMWLSPKFKLQVIKFVHDQLIEFRNEAGDNYKELTSSVQRFDNINYPQLAKGLNYIIFGNHKKGIRQIASKEQLTKLNELQKKLAFACDMGYINSFEKLLEEMRRIYSLKALTT